MSFKKFSQYIGKYIGIFLVAVLIIAVYKTFDNFKTIISFFELLMGIMTPFFIGFAIAFLLYKPCVMFEKLYDKLKFKFVQKHIRGLSILSVYASVVVILTIIANSLIPSLISNVRDFSEQVPSIIERLVGYIKSLNLNSLSFDPNVLWSYLSPERIVAFFDLKNFDKYVAGVKGISSVFVNGFMSVAISVYILADRANLKQLIKRICHIYIPNSKLNIINRYLSKIIEYIYKYIYCQLIDACVIFILALILLLCFRVPYSPVLALILGVSNMIPYFGAIIGTLVILLVVLVTNGIGQTALIGVLILVLQQIDANIIQPKIVSDSLAVKPLWVIFGILIGGAFFGVLGIFLSVPVMAVLKIIVLDILDYHEQKNLEKEA